MAAASHISCPGALARRIFSAPYDIALTLHRKRYTTDCVAVAKAKQSSLEERVEAFRTLVREAIAKADELGVELKPYDGKVALTWPSQVATGRRKRRYVLSVSCSALGGTGHFSWSGSSWRGVFAHAAEDVAQWTEEMGEGNHGK